MPYQNLTQLELGALKNDNLDIEVFERVNENTIETSTKGQKAIFATMLVEFEVNNGGFNQYYINTGMEYSKMAVEGFRLIGASAFADLMQRANKIAESRYAPEYLKKLQQNIEDFQTSYKDDPFDLLDKEFYEFPGGEDPKQLRIQYIRAHPEEFI